MHKLSKKQRYFLSVLSGILMTISFPYSGSLTIVGFIAWIPILLVEASISKENYRSRKVFTHSFITFLTYNLGTTWWVIYASGAGGCMAFIANSLLMAFVFYLFHLTKKHVGAKEGYIALLVYWISFEYFHYNWESSWPWLTYGNIFSIHPSWVQWYSYSGALGGTLWVLIINLLIFRAYQNVLLKGEAWKIQTSFFYLAGLFFIVPMIISISMYFSYTEKKDPVNVIVAQPNIDPYNEKFNVDLFEQLDVLFNSGKYKKELKPDLFIAPETAIAYSFYENQLQQIGLSNYFSKRQETLGGCPILIGASTIKIYDKKESPASTKLEDGPGFIEYYNTSLLFNNKTDYSFVHKSKLVPGVEKIPFTSYFSFLENLSIDLGGTTGTLGIEKEPQILTTEKFKFAPVICYESIFGEFVSQQCKKGAELICIITNDGWWRDTPGYKQHNSFASLRAIENRRSVVRSANTGTSSIINQRGEITHKTDWWVPATIQADVNLNKELTFYSIYGDFMGRSLSFVGVLLLLFTFVKYFKKLVNR